jgi:hypothetical protein
VEAVTFKASLSVSDDEPKFGFGKRPTKFEIIEQAGKLNHHQQQIPTTQQMKKVFLSIILIVTASFAYAGETRSYGELQAEREAIGDAACARFRQKQDAAAQVNKEGAEARAWQNSHNKKDRLYQRQQERIAAAGASRVNVSVTQ